MNRQLSASVLATLLTLAGPASAQAVLKPPVNAKPGTGKTANVIMTEGGAAPCPKGPNGEDACTVTVTGERSGDGGGDLPSRDGGVIVMGGGGGATPPSGAGPNTGGSSDAELAKERAKERARAQCIADYDADIAHSAANYNNRVTVHCGNLAQLKIRFGTPGGIELELDRIGAVIEELGRPFGRDCIGLASDTRNSEVRALRNVRNACLARAEKG